MGLASFVSTNRTAFPTERNSRRPFTSWENLGRLNSQNLACSHLCTSHDFEIIKRNIARDSGWGNVACHVECHTFIEVSLWEYPLDVLISELDPITVSGFSNLSKV